MASKYQHRHYEDFAREIGLALAHTEHNFTDATQRDAALTAIYFVRNKFTDLFTQDNSRFSYSHYLKVESEHYADRLQALRSL